MLACVTPSDPVDSGEAGLAPSSDTGEPGPPEQGAGALPEVPDADDLDPSENAVRVSLVAGELDHLVGGIAYAGYGYNGTSPGPTIRANVGDTVTVEFANMLADSTTVHWHGLPVSNEMDGAAWVDSPVPSGAGFTYSFVVSRTGTFWYHPHIDVSRQVDLGLYGALVVADPAEPVAERDLVIVLDAWGEFDASDPDHHELPPNPQSVTWTLNGMVLPSLSLAKGERVRARLLNASNTSYLALDWPGARWIGGEQGLSGVATEAIGVVLAPGNRREFEVYGSPTGADLSTAMWSAAGGAAIGPPRTLLTVGSDGESAQVEWPFHGLAASANPTYTDLVYVFAGGGSEGEWLINGEAWPVVTPTAVSLGQSLVVEVRNLSETNHPFHLHGHRFEVLTIDGTPPAHQTWADTVDVAIRSAVRLRIVADNPGEWLVHCHILGHEDNGMMTLFNVN